MLAAAALLIGAASVARAQGDAPIGSSSLPPPVTTADAPRPPPVRKPVPRHVAPPHHVTVHRVTVHRVTVPSALGTPVVPPRPAPLRRKPHPHIAAKPGIKPAAPASDLAKPAPKPAVKAAPAVAAAAAAAGVAAGAAVVAPAAPEPPKIDPAKGTATGLQLPRWAAFRSDEVNLRSGPGMQYPIDWVYHRRDLPVRIEREFGVWRLIEDQDGTKGWVHQATLTGQRGFLVPGADARTLRASGSETANAVALLKPGVVGTIRGCAADAAWCEVQAGSYRGWLRRTDMLGVDPGEAVGN